MKEKAIIRIIALCLYLNLKKWFERPYRQAVFIQHDCNIRKNYLIVQEFSQAFALQTCK